MKMSELCCICYKNNKRKISSHVFLLLDSFSHSFYYYYFEAFLSSWFLSYFHSKYTYLFSLDLISISVNKVQKFYIYNINFLCKKKKKLRFVEFKFCNFIKKYLVLWCIIVLILLDILKFYNVIYLFSIVILFSNYSRMFLKLI